MKNDYKNADGAWKYDDGKIRCGSVVKFTEKWSRPEERHLKFIVLESYDRGALIGCINTKISLGSMERVEWEMVEEC